MGERLPGFPAGVDVEYLGGRPGCLRLPSREAAREATHQEAGGRDGDQHRPTPDGPCDFCSPGSQLCPETHGHTFESDPLIGGLPRAHHYDRFTAAPSANVAAAWTNVSGFVLPSETDGAADPLGTGAADGATLSEGTGEAPVGGGGCPEPSSSTTTTMIAPATIPAPARMSQLEKPPPPSSAGSARRAVLGVAAGAAAGVGAPERTRRAASARRLARPQQALSHISGKRIGRPDWPCRRTGSGPATYQELAPHPGPVLRPPSDPPHSCRRTDRLRSCPSRSEGT